MTALAPGGTVVLHECVAESMDHDESTGRYIRVTLTGEYRLEEFLPYEPSNYVYEPLWRVVPMDDRDHEGWFIPADELLENLEA